MKYAARIAAAALGALLAVASPGVAAEPTTDDLARLATGFEGTGRARVSTGGQFVTLERPRVEPDGIAFDKVVPPPRTAFFRSPKAPAPAPSNPIAWGQIDQIDVEVSHRTRNVILGAVAGWMVSGIVGWLSYESQYTGDYPKVPAKTQFIGIISGGVFGVLVTSPSWRRVYPSVP